MRKLFTRGLNRNWQKKVSIDFKEGKHGPVVLLLSPGAMASSVGPDLEPVMV